jgi:NTE family protein
MSTNAKGQQIALLLSGGGFRAALFHLGAMRRLHHLGVLARVTTISSVSGGSIIAATYCRMLLDRPFRFDEFEKRLVDGIKSNVRFRWTRHRARRLLRDFIIGSKSPDQPTILEAILEETFGLNIAVNALPSSPQLIINATGLHDGQAYHLLKDNPSFASMPLARAVVASAAFPIVLEPVVVAHSRVPDGKLVLVDGGVSDNRGLQCLLKMDFGEHTYIILSDASRYTQPRASKPLRFGIFDTLDRLKIISSNAEVFRANKKLSDLKKAGNIAGYCGFTIAERPAIGTDPQSMRYFLPSRYIDWARHIRDHQHASYDELPMRLTDWLAEVRTDLDALDDLEIRCLMYQGYINVTSAILSDCWKVLPEKLRRSVTNVLIHVSDPSGGIDQMEGTNFTFFHETQSRLVAKGHIRKADSFPLPMTWRKFNDDLKSKGLVTKWKSLGDIENLHNTTSIETNIIRKAERHLSASNVNSIVLRRARRLILNFKAKLTC